MSNSEAVSPHGGPLSSMVDLNPSSDVGYTYQRADGIVEFAANAQDAIARCPVLGKMAIDAPEQVSILLELATLGKELMEKKAEIELAELKPEIEPQPEKFKKKDKKDEIFLEETKPEQKLLDTDDPVYDEKISDFDIDESPKRSFEVKVSLNEELNPVAIPSHGLQSDEADRPVDSVAFSQLDQIQDVVTYPLAPERVDEVLVIVNTEIPEPVVEMHTNSTDKENFIAPSRVELLPVGQPDDVVLVIDSEKTSLEIAETPPMLMVSIQNKEEPMVTIYKPKIDGITVAATTPRGEVNGESFSAATLSLNEVTVSTSEVNVVSFAVKKDLGLQYVSAEVHRLPPEPLIMEGSHYDSVAVPKAESKTVATPHIEMLPVLIRNLDFELLGMNHNEAEKTITLEEIRLKVDDQPFEQTLVQLAVYMLVAEDLPDRQNLRDIVGGIKKSLLDTFSDGKTDQSERSITPEVYESTLALMRFLGNQEPEEVLSQFTGEHGEDFLLKTLDYISQLNEIDGQEEFFANDEMVATYNRLLELTTKEPIQPREFGTELPIQLQPDMEMVITEGRSVEDKSVIRDLESHTASLPDNGEKSFDLEFILASEIPVLSRTGMKPPEIREREKDTRGFSLGSFIQATAENQPLEQTFAQLVLNLPEIAQTPDQVILMEIVDDIKKILTDKYSSHSTSQDQHVESISADLMEKTLELIKLLGYQKPEEVMEQCVSEYGTNFLLQGLSYICESNDVYKRKLLEASILLVGIKSRNKPSMEVAVFGMTSMFVFVPGI